jgi:hypothetical protein
VRFLCVAILLTSSANAFGIYDSVLEHAKELREIAAVSVAAGDLVAELGGDDGSLLKELEYIERESQALATELSEMDYLSEEGKALLGGPNMAAKRLATNLRRLTNYTRRVKSFVAKMAILGENGSLVLSGIETNISLNEIQKNQQALIAQQERMNLLKKRQYLEEEKERHRWEKFSSEQRRIRQGYMGKSHGQH